MANFGQLILTTLGLQEQIKAQSGDGLKFKRIAMGSGSFSGNASTLTSLVTEKVSVAITNGYIQNNAYTVEGLFSNEALQTGFEWREIGVFIEDAHGNEILYCYANAGDAYDYIPATEDERYSKYIRIAMVVGNTTNITIVESEGYVYVDAQSFNAHRNDKDNPHGVTASQIGAVDAQTLKAHTDNKNNPHGVTAEQIGAAAASSHNIKTYTNLSQLGLSNGATISQVARALPGSSMLRIYVLTSENSKLAPSATNGWLEISRPATNHAELHYATSTGISYFATVLNIGKDNEQVSDWVQIANVSDLWNYLPLAGGVMTGQGFYLNNKTGRIVNNENGFWIRVASSDVDNNTDSRHLKLWNATYQSDLTKALVLFDTTTGKDYLIYGEHHKPTAAEVTAGTLAGKVQANASAAATVTTAQVRDIYAGTSDLTAGTSSLTSGTLYFVYE